MALAASIAHAGEADADKSDVDKPDVDRRIAAHLDAGEFAPALRLAEATTDPAGRDARLAHIAAAQRGVGARTAAVATAGHHHYHFRSKP